MCPLEMGARDDGRSGNPRGCSVLLRLVVACPSRWAAAEDERRGAGRARGRTIGDGDSLRPPVPWPGWEGVARLLPAAAGAVAVQPADAGADAAAGLGAAAALGGACDREAQAGRGQPDRG